MISFPNIICLVSLVLGASATAIDSLQRRNEPTTPHRRQDVPIVSAAPATSANDYTGNIYLFNFGSDAPTDCGGKGSNGDLIATVGWKVFDKYEEESNNPVTSSICNKPIIVNFDGKSIEVTVVGRCPPTVCTGNDLGLTPTGFTKLGLPSGLPPLTSEPGATWHFA